MDSIANLLTSIRNAELASHSELQVPSSKLSLALLAILQKDGYIASFEEVENKPRNLITIHLIKNVRHSYKRVSKLGRRMYVPASQIPRVLNGLGLVILSTSQGLLSGKDARKAGIGGEVLCEVY